MRNSCFRTFAYSLIKRNIVRIQRQKFGCHTLLQILREGTSKHSKAGPFGDKKIEKKSHGVETNWNGNP